jgi:hypothetical protein
VRLDIGVEATSSDMGQAESAGSEASMLGTGEREPSDYPTLQGSVVPR